MEDRRYDGWRIRFGFLGGNLLQGLVDAYLYDEDASAREYARLCRAAIEEAYPGATVEVPYALHASGALPVTMTIRVWDPEGGDWEPGAYPHTGSWIAADVEDICGEVWESMEWLVPAVEATRYVVIADGAYVYPVLRDDLGPDDDPDTLAAMTPDQYRDWCERVPADERYAPIGTVEMTRFCHWLEEHGAERWDIAPRGHRA